MVRTRIYHKLGIILVLLLYAGGAAWAASAQPLSEHSLYTQEQLLGQFLQRKTALATNIDFYSGFMYDMLGIPQELYTPLFAVARAAGWSAHRMEELTSGGKLIRPRYECVEEHRSYIPEQDR